MRLEHGKYEVGGGDLVQRRSIPPSLARLALALSSRAGLLPLPVPIRRPAATQEETRISPNRLSLLPLHSLAGRRLSSAIHRRCPLSPLAARESCSHLGCACHKVFRTDPNVFRARHKALSDAKRVERPGRTLKTAQEKMQIMQRGSRKYGRFTREILEVEGRLGILTRIEKIRRSTLLLSLRREVKGQARASWTSSFLAFLFLFFLLFLEIGNFSFFFPFFSAQNRCVRLSLMVGHRPEFAVL